MKSGVLPLTIFLNVPMLFKEDRKADSGDREGKHQMFHITIKK